MGIYVANYIESNDLRRGSNVIAPDEVTKYYYFNENNANIESAGIDVHVIIGNRKNIGMLLLMRFTKYIPHFKKRKKQSAHMLFNEIVSTLKNDGLERRREGGSSGLICHSKIIKKMLKTPNSSPRTSKGKLLLQYFQFVNLITKFIFFIIAKQTL